MEHAHPTTKWLPAAILQIDTTYQRRLSQWKLRLLIKTFDEHKLGLLEVSQRHDGYWLIDGQHRLAAARRCGVSLIYCHVHGGLTLAQEANMRLGFHNRKADTPIERFRLELAEGDPAAVHVQAIVREAGMEIHLADTGCRDPRLLRCVGNLKRIYARYRNGPALLGRVLYISYHAWPDELAGRTGRIVMGIGTFLNYYPEVPDAELIAKLQERTAATLMRLIQSEILGSLGGPDVAMGRLILMAYNRRKRNRLPDRFLQGSHRAEATP